LAGAAIAEALIADAPKDEANHGRGGGGAGGGMGGMGM